MTVTRMKERIQLTSNTLSATVRTGQTAGVRSVAGSAHAETSVDLPGSNARWLLHYRRFIQLTVLVLHREFL